jgi:hypothetical protein
LKRKAAALDVGQPGTLDGGAAKLREDLAVVARAAVPRATCARWASRVLAARSAWTEDFGGDQYSLGRAFYAHLETDKTREYFDDAASSDARVEAAAPGLQSALRSLMEQAVSGRVVPRPGWCGAGVHVFPRGRSVAEEGGAIHFDTEGLSEPHMKLRKRACSLVLMLKPPASGGGLTLWRLLYEGDDDVDEAKRHAADRELVRLEAGDAVLFDSYRLHQIESFRGKRHRISASLHAAELHDGLWECWF